MYNSIYQAVEKVKKLPDYLDLTDSNFTLNGYDYPRIELTDAISRVLKKSKYQPHSKGIIQARETIAEYYANDRILVSPDQIFIFSSTSEIYNLLFALFTKPGDEIILPKPSYPLFEYFARLNKVQIKYYSLSEENGWMIDIKSLTENITSKTKFIVLISPNNPTGQIISSSQMEEIVKISSQKNVHIICDEVFSEFNYLVDPLPRPMKTASDSLVFTLNGISKMFALPDFNLAWLTVSSSNKSRLRSATEQLDTANDMFLNANYLIQSILPEIFKYGAGFKKSMISDFQLKAGRVNNLIQKYSNKIRFTDIQGGIHGMLSFRSETIEEEAFVLNLLKSEKLLIHPGYFYDYTPKGQVTLVFSIVLDQEHLLHKLRSVLMQIQSFK